jgi:tetratricopeptide (TPR) repeat protein
MSALKAAPAVEPTGAATGALERTAAGSAGAEEFDRLQAAGQAAFEAGSLDESRALLGRALAWAEERGDRRRADLALCNLCAATLGLEAGEPLPARTTARLREVLMRNEDLTNCRLAAYLLARVYELKKEAKKGLFYARVGLDRAQLLARPEWIASSRNQIGNLLLADSFFDRATEEYEAALALHPQESAARRAVIRGNLGYAWLVRGDRRRGAKLLFESLRTLRRLSARREQVFPHLDLCYLYLELGRHRRAIRHGQAGLALAEEYRDFDAVKNALYLLGEACCLAGDEEAANRHFGRLAADFYPGSSGIAQFLMTVDVRKVINLRA